MEPPISAEKIELIKKYHADNLTNRQIAAAVEVHHGTVARYLKKLGLECNTANEPIDMVSDTEARCKKCGDVKLLSQFQYGRKGQKYEYRFSFCNECRRKQSYLNINSDINKYLSDRYHRLVSRAKKDNVLCTITKQEFIDQYHTQDGLCFYTFKKMLCEVGHGSQRDALSVDKIEPDKGYILGNTVFCRNQVNTVKSDLPLHQVRTWLPFFYERIAGITRTVFYTVFEMPPSEVGSIIFELQKFSGGTIKNVVPTFPGIGPDKLILVHNPTCCTYHVEIATTRDMYIMELESLLDSFNISKSAKYWIGFEPWS